MDQFVKRLEQTWLLVDEGAVTTAGSTEAFGGLDACCDLALGLDDGMRLMPDAEATALLPPRPSISEVAPAATLRWRSFRCGRTTSKNRANPSGPTSIPSRYYARSNLRWTLSPLLELRSPGQEIAELE
jgi:hypothetical protein